MRARALKTVALLVVAVVLVALGAALALAVSGPRWSAEEVETAVVMTLLGEEPDQFLVTGRYRFLVDVTRRNDKRLLPGLLDIPLGETTVQVRMPATASYGIDLSGITAEAVRVDPDGLVTIQVPEVQLDALDPDFENLEMRTEVGWARLHSSSGQRVEQETLRELRSQLGERADRHLERSQRPLENTATALENLLRPVLVAAGVEAPRFRFVFGPELTLDRGAAPAPETE